MPRLFAGDRACGHRLGVGRIGLGEPLTRCLLKTPSLGLSLSSAFLSSRLARRGADGLGVALGLVEDVGALGLGVRDDLTGTLPCCFNEALSLRARLWLQLGNPCEGLFCGFEGLHRGNILGLRETLRGTLRRLALDVEALGDQVLTQAHMKVANLLPPGHSTPVLVAHVAVLGVGARPVLAEAAGVLRIIPEGVRENVHVRGVLAVLERDPEDAIHATRDDVRGEVLKDLIEVALGLIPVLRDPP